MDKPKRQRMKPHHKLDFSKEVIMSEAEFNEKKREVELGIAKFQYVQPRWRSWAMWLSVLGALWTIASALGLPEKWGIEEGTFKTIVDAVGVILIGFGVLNDPTNPYEF